MCWRGSPTPTAMASGAPTDKAANASLDEPMCDIEEPGSATSSAVSAIPAVRLATIQPYVRPVWVTPFGGPVCRR